MPRAGVAGGVGDDDRRHPVRGAAHHLLGEVPAQAQPDQHHPPDGQRVEQGEHILHRGLEVEAPGRLAVGAQVGDHQPEAVLQHVDLRGPRPVIQRSAMQQDHRPFTGVAAGPVADGRVGPHQLVRVQKGHLFLSRAAGADGVAATSAAASGTRPIPG